MNLITEHNVENKEGIDALFFHATEGILVTNSKGEITKANPSIEKLFGYEQEELIGQKVEMLVPKKYSAGHHAHRDKFHGNPHARSMGAGMDLYGLRKDGSEVPVEISLSPYEIGGKKFVIAFVVDISVRKMAEEKLKNYSDDLEKQVKNRTLILEEAVAELEKTKMELKSSLDKEKDLNELKSRFVSMASHEFRTPLTTMMSSLSLISKYGEINETEKQSKHVTKIKKSINHLTDLLNDFLSVSKLEEGKVEWLPTELDLKEFIEDVLSEMHYVLKEGQSFSFSYSGESTVTADKKMLKQIFFNLLSNAIKFSPEKSEIKIEVSVRDNTLNISVKDQGIGISEEDQRSLFERFFRGQNATNIQGTGLGLNIVARFVDQMKGKIECKSELDVGTEFIIELPV